MNSNQLSTAVYAGTFDPITNGHTDIIERGAGLFGGLIVAVVYDSAKNALFSYEERLEMAQDAVAERGIPNVQVEGFKGLLVDYVKERGSRMIVRGLRAVSDYEYEAQMALMNRKISKEVETVFLMTSEDRSSISASMVRDIARHGGDVTRFVPKMAAQKLKQAFAE